MGDSMFSRVITRVVGSMTKGNVGRFFTRGLVNDATLKPHSSEHLAQQLEELQARNLQGEKITLKAGEKLQGLDTHFNKNMIGKSPPLYKPEDLQRLSPNEKQHFKLMSDKYLARIVDYVLREDTPCIKTVPHPEDPPVYYVHHDKTIMGKKLNRVEDVLNLPDGKIYDPASIKR
jgi:hypothetical protein